MLLCLTLCLSFSHVQHTRSAMAAIGLSTAQQEGVFQIIAAILHLGNVAFTDSSSDGSAATDAGTGIRILAGGGAQEAVEVAAELLGVDPVLLVTVLTTRTIQTPEGGSYDPKGLCQGSGFARLFSALVVTPSCTRRYRSCCNTSWYARAS